jgi:hypothetical protein
MPRARPMKMMGSLSLRRSCMWGVLMQDLSAPIVESAQMRMYRMQRRTLLAISKCMNEGSTENALVESAILSVE